MAQAKQLTDPFDFLDYSGAIDDGLAASEGPIPAVPDISAVRQNEPGDPYEFLGTEPGVVMQRNPPASVRQGSLAPKWGFSDQLMSGAALGFGPNLAGIEQWMTAPSESKLSLPQHIFNAEQDQAAYERANPGLASGLEIAGSIPTTLAVNALTPGLSAGLRSSSLPTRVAANALAGAEAGALQTPITGGSPVENALLGASFGAPGPLLGAGIGRVLSPKVAPDITQIVRDLETQGVKLRPSQVAMSQAVRRADEFISSGGNEQQLRDYTRAVSRTFGEDTDSLTGEVAGRAWDRITAQMDGISNLTTVVQDAPLQQGMALVSAGLKGLPQESQRAVRSAIKEINSSFTAGSLDGSVYQKLTSKGGTLMNLYANPATRRAGGQLRELLDDAVERHSAPATREMWKDARAEMKNLLAIQPLIEGNPSGIINPQKVHGQVKKFFDEYGWGVNLPGSIGTLAEGGRVMPQVTPFGDAVMREKQAWYTRPSALLGNAAVGTGLIELQLLNQTPWAALSMAGSSAALSGVRRGREAYQRSNFARNALTGNVTSPSQAYLGARAGAIGLANELRSDGSVYSTASSGLEGAMNVLTSMFADEETP